MVTEPFLSISNLEIILFEQMGFLVCQGYLHRQKVFSASFIFGSLNNSRFDRAASKQFHNPQPKEVHHEDFPVRHPFFQLPADEREKKIRCATMSSSLAISKTISAR
jgi:hypothetical protein